MGVRTPNPRTLCPRFTDPIQRNFPAAPDNSLHDRSRQIVITSRLAGSPFPAQAKDPTALASLMGLHAHLSQWKISSNGGDVTTTLTAQTLEGL
jgi:hypothetical protein